MKLDKQQKIDRLKEGIASDATPDSVKEEMRAMLIELEKPEPPAAPATPPPAAPKSKAVRKPKVFSVDTLPHVVYFKENNIAYSKENLGKTLYNAYGTIVYQAKHNKGNFVAASERYLERVKAHLAAKTPPAAQEPPPAPPAPEPELTEKEKDDILKAALEKKKKRAERTAAEEEDHILATARLKKQNRNERRSQLN